MNPILRNSNVVGKIVKRAITIKSNKYLPCNPKCLCLMYLDLNDIKSQDYYKNCFREKVKNT